MIICLVYFSELIVIALIGYSVNYKDGCPFEFGTASFSFHFNLHQDRLVLESNDSLNMGTKHNSVWVIIKAFAWCR